MATATQQAVIGIFLDRHQAKHAVDELVQAGFDRDRISLISPGREYEGRTVDEESVGVGAAAGAAVGAGAAGLASLGMSFGVIPVVGPILAIGPLAAALLSAAGGAAAGGIVGALAGLGLSEGEAKYYEGELGAGRTLVTVDADGREAEARAVLDRAGALDRLGSTTAHGHPAGIAGPESPPRDFHAPTAHPAGAVGAANPPSNVPAHTGHPAGIVGPAESGHMGEKGGCCAHEEAPADSTGGSCRPG